MKKVKGTFSQLGLFKRNSNTQQLVIGAIAGYFTGYVTVKIGKKAALVLGSGILLFQIAQNQGFTKSNWEDAKVKAKSMQQKIEGGVFSCWRENATKYARKNTCFAASFAGGFLLGMGTV